MVQAYAIPLVNFFARHGFSTHPLAYMLDSLVRVSRRAVWELSANVKPRPLARYRQGDNPCFYPAQITDIGLHPEHTASRLACISLGAARARKHFPLNNFRYFLTLFSKFFSSFPRGTCSLSVSRQYLALDGIYHQLRAAFPNNPTRRKHLVRLPTTYRRDSHPL
jgi:hypothetical protein